MLTLSISDFLIFKKTSCFDSDIILKKQLSCFFLCQTNLFCVEIKMRKHCIYNDLFLNKLEVNENSVFKISVAETDAVETDENSVDNCVCVTDVFIKKNAF